MNHNDASRPPSAANRSPPASVTGDALSSLGDDNASYVDDPRIKALQENVDYGMEIITNADFWDLENRIVIRDGCQRLTGEHPLRQVPEIGIPAWTSGRAQCGLTAGRTLRSARGRDCSDAAGE